TRRSSDLAVGEAQLAGGIGGAELLVADELEGLAHGGQRVGVQCRKVDAVAVVAAEAADDVRQLAEAEVVQRAEHIEVRAAAADQGVRAGTADQHVVAAAAVEDVVAGAADQQVAAAVAGEVV